MGTATKAVSKAIENLGKPPTGLIAEIKGMSSLLTETFSSLQTGLMVAIVVILLLLAANYQSFGVSIAVLSTIPAVLLGAHADVIDYRFYTQSAILYGHHYVYRSVGGQCHPDCNQCRSRCDWNIRIPLRQRSVSASIRLRPILMTSLAMIAGMIPMASGLGEAGDQSAPLGRAVIGGLIASTFAALFIVPLVYGWIRQKTSFHSVSLLPEDQKK